MTVHFIPSLLAQIYTQVLWVLRKDLEKGSVRREFLQQRLREGRKVLYHLGVHFGFTWPFSILSTHAPHPHTPHRVSLSSKRPKHSVSLWPPGHLFQNPLSILPYYSHQMTILSLLLDSKPLRAGTTSCSSWWLAHSNHSIICINRTELKTAAK